MMKNRRNMCLGIILLSAMLMLTITPFMVTYASATTITAGGIHSLALKDNGDVYAWGENSKGQLGTGYSDNNPPTISLYK
ncbi:MAG: hypothetical protein LBQ00_02500 [Syntrophobacterales bacterium]|nr:hypothetical protein [Syntrophobacterales bacterium]